MATGITHFFIGCVLALALFSGIFLVDLDHLKTHNIKQLWNGFIGKSYTSSDRDDTNHFFHKQAGYNIIFFITGIMLMFSLGLFLHLKMDGIF